ncbi:MAG TPA: hypothetical protein VKG25_02375 [Bryobacteraceae bacterium]|nr:hypothetical protein [Bryobacteraceae bacterium]
MDKLSTLSATLSANQLILIGAVVVVLVLGIVAFVALRKRRTGKLRTKFGDAEYGRALAKDGNRRDAEARLDDRTQRVEGLNVRPLAPADRTRFTETWRGVQSRFVDGPAGAVAEADQLLGDVMSARGYPVSNFEQRAADISVGHPVVLENYRAAHDIALRQTQGQASTEELRQAMIHYRTLFEDLVGEPEMTMAKPA